MEQLLRNPLALLAAMAGAVIVTNVVTYNIAAPGPSYCDAQIAASLERLETQNQADLDDLERALRPAEGLNPDRPGGLDWNRSVR